MSASDIPPGPYTLGSPATQSLRLGGATWTVHDAKGRTILATTNEGWARAVLALPELVETLVRIVADQEGRGEGSAFCATQAIAALEKAGLR